MQDVYENVVIACFCREWAGDAAQDVVYAWLERHIQTLPRYETTFLTEAQVRLVREHSCGLWLTAC